MSNIDPVRRWRFETAAELSDAMPQIARQVDRLIIVRPSRGDGPSYVEDLFQGVGRPPPPELSVWEEMMTDWCDEYRHYTPETRIVEAKVEPGVFIFDLVAERVVGAYGLSTRPAQPRDRAKMRGFPDVNVGVRAVLGDQAFLADRGHFLAHGSGGTLDINLFPQLRDLNRGWSHEGKLFRRMERYVAEHPGVFYFHRPIYVDATWIPGELEFGILTVDGTWWVERFANR